MVLMTLLRWGANRGVGCKDQLANRNCLNHAALSVCKVADQLLDFNVQRYFLVEFLRALFLSLNRTIVLSVTWKKVEKEEVSHDPIKVWKLATGANPVEDRIRIQKGGMNQSARPNCIKWNLILSPSQQWHKHRVEDIEFQVTEFLWDAAWQSKIAVWINIQV